MAKIEDDVLDSESDNPNKKIDKKKILIFLLPILIVIGLIVSFYSVFSQKINPNDDLPYAVVNKPGDGAENPGKTLIFYDLPEISVQVKNSSGGFDIAKIRLSVEISSIEDVKVVEGVMPQINDAVIAHTIELTSDELNGANGLYRLKDELLYRTNLITDPVKVSNINIKSFEIQKK